MASQQTKMSGLARTDPDRVSFTPWPTIRSGVVWSFLAVAVIRKTKAHQTKEMKGRSQLLALRLSPPPPAQWGRIPTDPASTLAGRAGSLSGTDPKKNAGSL
jgi:hypothetical protein